MRKSALAIPDTNALRSLNKEALIELVIELLENRDSLDQRYKALLKKIYGRSSERLSAPEEQLLLDFMNGQEPLEQAEEPQVSYRKKAKKKANKRLPIPGDIPRHEEIHEPGELPEGARKIGEEVTEVLAYKPPEVFVRKIVRPKYVTPEEEFVTAELKLPLPKSNADASLLAQLLVSKFVDHLPFHRQVQIFRRLNIRIAASTVDNWQASSCRLLEPLYRKLAELVQQASYIMADETTIGVLRSGEQKGKKAFQGYHWVYYAPFIRLALFEYQPGRHKEYPEAFLASFQGILQTDAYGGYDQFGKKEGITMLACWAHARRKFHDALGNDGIRARHALELIQRLYGVERQAKEKKLSPKDRQMLREEKARPVLKELKQWLDEQAGQVLPKSKIREAIGYVLNLWPKLEAYVKHGQSEIDNNWVENSIRPVALGRKNYLFAGSHQGAQRAAMLYSFFASCKMSEVNPYEWLKDVLDRMQEHPINQIELLLPHLWRPAGEI